MRIFYTCLLLVHSISVPGQFHQYVGKSNSDFQFGVSLKASVELKRKEPHFRLAFSTGIGYPVANDIFYPAINAEYQIYTGGFGTKSGSEKKYKYKLYSDFIASAMMTGGANYKRHPEYVPLYYFTDFAQPSLINPFKDFSMSAGANLVISLNKEKTCLQRVAYVNLHIRYFQIGYYNDGGAILDIWGDKHDRYYTGGGFAVVTIPTVNPINTFSISYHKFTGEYKNAFDITNDMNLAYVYYKDTSQQYYNRSLWNFSIGSSKYGLSAFFQRNNPIGRWDFQNLIHYTGDFGYHQIPYHRYNSFGINYSTSRYQISPL
jgi:hypothetical protein